MGPTGADVNLIQIHPTRRCNLRCGHCYSSSGPELGRELAIDAIERFLGEAAVEGFNAIGVSGGEPFTYKALPRLLRSARALGYATSVTSNGLLLDARRLAAVAPHLSLLAISLDGVPASHDRVRGQPRAFDRMRARLQGVRDAGLRFGFIFTLTLENLHELEWVARFACDEGASLLQIHPLEQVGRARDYELLPPDDLELVYAFVEVARLNRLLGEHITLQFDVADRSLIEREPQRAFAAGAPTREAAQAARLAELVSPLVLQDDGWIVPVQFGFSTDHAVAHLQHVSFRAQAARWKRENCARFFDFARSVWDDLRPSPAHLPFTNWYAAITGASRRGAAPLRLPLADPVPSGRIAHNRPTRAA